MNINETANNMILLNMQQSSENLNKIFVDAYLYRNFFYINETAQQNWFCFYYTNTL